MLTAEAYWRSGAGLAHITPPSNRAPEGEGFDETLQAVVDEGVVLDYGCGIGRLAHCFDPERYIGVDICAAAIDIARGALPWHRFELLCSGRDHPRADVTLLHTVLLHVPDGEPLQQLVAGLASDRVIVSEILGRRWRRAGDPPVFNREAEDYVAIFSPRYVLQRAIAHPYPHYRETDLTMLEFVRC